MDKKSIIGLLLIGGILIGWMYLARPTPEELAKKRAQFVTDSTAEFNSTAKVKNDATPATTFAAANIQTSAFTDATGKVKLNVDAVGATFPIGLNTATTRNNCKIINAGTADIYTVGVKATPLVTPPDHT